jgi:hypothetical protein
MADIAKSGTPSLCSVLPPQSQTVSGLLAGEAIAAGDLCYIKSDGKVWRTNGTALNAAADAIGMAAQAAGVNGPVTLYFDVNFYYGAGLTPGAKYYASTTAGALSDAATTGGLKVVAYAIDATRIHVKQAIN